MCQIWGHRSQVCKGKTRCPACGGREGVHDELICKTQAPKCHFCQGEHVSTNIAVCPEYNIQKKIKELIFIKNYSFKEAFETVKFKPFADSLSFIPNRPITFDSANFPDLDTSKNSTNLTRKRAKNQYDSEEENILHLGLRNKLDLVPQDQFLILNSQTRK